MLTASEITRLLDVANAGVQRGEVALARKVYQGILAGHPDHVPTLVSLAMSHIAVGQYDLRCSRTSGCIDKIGH